MTYGFFLEYIPSKVSALGTIPQSTPNFPGDQPQSREGPPGTIKKSPAGVIPNTERNRRHRRGTFPALVIVFGNIPPTARPSLNLIKNVYP